jgi:hypothetical protein
MSATAKKIPASDAMSGVRKIVTEAQATFRTLLLELESDGGLTRDRYVRFLTMQYHLTNGVQKHFFACAAHPTMAHKKSLRKFLVDFGNEEESHYLIAAKDLENLDVSVGADAPLDVKLWWAYFNSIVPERPFVRLGATCILENISAGNGDVVKRLLASASYLNPRCTRFLVIHQHEDLPHGDQILAALSAVTLSDQEVQDLVDGARAGLTMYLRMFNWAMTGTAD